MSHDNLRWLQAAAFLRTFARQRIVDADLVSGVDPRGAKGTIALPQTAAGQRNRNARPIKSRFYHSVA